MVPTGDEGGWCSKWEKQHCCRLKSCLKQKLRRSQVPGFLPEFLQAGEQPLWTRVVWSLFKAASPVAFRAKQELRRPILGRGEGQRFCWWVVCYFRARRRLPRSFGLQFAAAQQYYPCSWSRLSCECPFAPFPSAVCLPFLVPRLSGRQDRSQQLTAASPAQGSQELACGSWISWTHEG